MLKVSVLKKHFFTTFEKTQRFHVRPMQQRNLCNLTFGIICDSQKLCMKSKVLYENIRDSWKLCPFSKVTDTMTSAVHNLFKFVKVWNGENFCL
jgi:hypothetical protein